MCWGRNLRVPPSFCPCACIWALLRKLHRSTFCNQTWPRILMQDRQPECHAWGVGLEGWGGGVGWCVCVEGLLLKTTGRDRFSFVNLRNLVSGGLALEANTACAVASIPCVKHLHQPKAKEIEFYSYHPLLVCYQSVCCLCCL